MKNLVARLREISKKAVRNPGKLKQSIKDPEKREHHIDRLRLAFKKDRINRDVERGEMSKRLATVFDEDQGQIERYQQEIEHNHEFYSVYNERREELENEGVLGGTTSTLDTQTMYVVCRILEPEIIVETGVRYGAFDAHITAALHKNGHGLMYGIELPDSIKKFEFGYLIPEEYREQWVCELGDSKNVLPELLNEVDSVDVFLHDSLHSRDHMQWEYSAVYPKISNGGVLASHDVLMNNVYQKYVDKTDIDWTRVGNVGVGRKRADNSLPMSALP